MANAKPVTAEVRADVHYPNLNMIISYKYGLISNIYFSALHFISIRNGHFIECSVSLINVKSKIRKKCLKARQDEMSI